MYPDIVTAHKLKYHVFQDDRFVDLNLYQCGWEQTEPLHTRGPYVRNHYLFHFVLSGKGVLLVNGKEYSITAGQGFLIEPGYVTIYRADEAEPWEYTWVEFDGLRVHESLRTAGISMADPVYIPASQAAAHRLKEQMLYLVEHHNDSTTRLIGQGFLFLDQLVQSSAGKQTHSDKRLRDFYIKEALSFIELNYQRDISVEDIAAACGLNRSYFGKLFRAAVGEPPQTFLLHYRMNCAAQMLRESRALVSEIAVRVSYENPMHFSRAFKGIFGVSPREYRQAHFIEPSRENERRNRYADQAQ